MKSLIFLLVLIIGALDVHAQTWTGAVSTDWNNAGNWTSPASIPGTGATVNIGSVANGRYPVLSASKTISTLNLGNWSGSVSLTVTNGATLTVTGAITITNNAGLYLKQNGSLNQTGTSFTMNYTNTFIDVTYGNFTTAADVQFNGPVTVGKGNLWFKGTFNSGSGYTFDAGKGTLTADKAATFNENFVMDSGALRLKAGFTVASGKTFNVTATNLRTTGTVNIYGTLTMQSGLMVFDSFSTVTVGSGGRFNITAGTVYFKGSAIIGNNGQINAGDGDVIFEKDITAQSSSVFTVDDGTLTFLGDATFQSTAALTVTGSGTVDIQGDGAFRSSGTLNVGSGNLSISGDVTFSNTGTLSATSANIEFDGNVTIAGNGGSFSAGSSEVTVKGGTLDVSGTINTGTSTFIFEGTSNQVITGTNVSSVTFYNLVVNTDGDLNSDLNITVTNDASITSTSSSLSVDAGKVIDIQGDFTNNSTTTVSTNHPFITTINVTGSNSILVIFNENITQSTATVASNYSVSPTLGTITPSYSTSTPDRVTLNFGSSIASATEYSLTVNNITNTAGQSVSTNHVKRFEKPAISAPTTASSNVSATKYKDRITFSWTPGNGAGRIVIMREASAVNATPANLLAYTANAAFGTTGTLLSGSNYVVYNGTGSSVTVTGLKQNTTYYIRIVEYNGSLLTTTYGTTYKDDSSYTYFTLDAKAFLEGTYNVSTGLMRNDLNVAGVLPLQQPFNDTVWSYAGTESVSSIPSSSIVDWVLLELRQGSSASQAATSTPVMRKAAFIKQNGQIVALDGTSFPEFQTPRAGNYYLTIIHDTHLPIISSSPLALQGNGSWGMDFTSSSSNIFQGTVITAGSKVVLPAARLTKKNAAKANGSTAKTTMWNQRNVTGYSKMDLNRDGKVDAEDRSIMYNNGNMDNYVQ